MPKQQPHDDADDIDPEVHLNGTSGEALVAQQNAVITALTALQKALAEAWPHMRDYYVKGEQAYVRFSQMSDTMRAGVEYIEMMQRNFTARHDRLVAKVQRRSTLHRKEVPINLAGKDNTAESMAKEAATVLVADLIGKGASNLAVAIGVCKALRFELISTHEPGSDEYLSFLTSMYSSLRA